MSLLLVSQLLFWIGLLFAVVIGVLTVLAMAQAGGAQPFEVMLIALGFLFPMTLFQAAYVAHYLATAGALTPH